MNHVEDNFAICVRVDEAYEEQTPSCLLRTAIARTLQAHEVPEDAGVTLLITSDEDVHKLNRRYRNVDAPTDVLSFPAEADDSLPPDSGERPYLGDIIVAFPYTEAHAQEDGHQLDHVLVLLAVHGTLHLLGYDHDNAASQSEMWETQAHILARMDIPPDVMPPLYEFPAEE